MIPVRSSRAFLAWLVTWLAAIKLLADSVNGALLRSGFHGPSVSALFGAVLAVLLFLYLSAREKILFLTVAALWALLLVPQWGHSGPFQDYGPRWAMNSSFILLAFLAFRRILAVEPAGRRYCATVAIVSYIILLANLVLGWLGIGASQYHGIGATGFIYAGNEMSVALLAAVAVLTFCAVTGDRLRLFYLVILPTAVAAAALKVTKTAMAGILIVTFLLPLLLTKRPFGIFAPHRATKRSYLLLLLLVAIPLVLLSAYELGLFNRIAYWAPRLDLVTLLFSHRNVYATQAFAYAQTNFDGLNVLFGGGTHWIAVTGRITEMDPVDLFMTFGLLGAILAYLPFLAAGVLCCLRLTGNRQNAAEARFGLAITIILIAISATAGHVLNSGTAGLLLGVSLALGSTTRRRAVIYRGEALRGGRAETLPFVPRPLGGSGEA